jgi:hypothetical protein
MNYLTTNTSADYYNGSKKLSDLIDTKYYDKIMTKLHLKTREEYQRTKRHSQNLTKYSGDTVKRQSLLAN